MILVFSAEIRDVRIWATFPLFQMMATVQKNPRGLGSRKTWTLFSLLPYPALSPMSPFGQEFPIESAACEHVNLDSCVTQTVENRGS